MKTVTSPPSFRVTYAWDAVGQRSVMTAPTGGRFSYQYDATGRFSRLINPEGDRTTYAYDVDSRRTVKRLANGTRASFSYDAASNLTTLANMFPDGTYISKYDYKYDPTGNRYAVAEADGSRVTWLYDNLYQLTGENRTGTTPFRNTFTYDPLGNRLTKTESGARTTYTYDAANQLRYGQDTTGRTTYTFDAAGNQAKEKSPAGAITTTTWNYENQPTLYKLPDATRVTMSYHPDLLRVQKDAPTGTTKFIWDQQNYLAEADGSNVVTTVYTNEPARYGNLVSSKIGATPYYHSFDAIGSTREVTSFVGDRVGTWIFSATGALHQQIGSISTPLLWNGQEGYFLDSHYESYYVRRRVVSPGLGRWHSTDPIGLIDFENLFKYCSNSVLMLRDPSGLKPPQLRPDGTVPSYSGWEVTACIQLLDYFANQQLVRLGATCGSDLLLHYLSQKGGTGICPFSCRQSLKRYVESDWQEYQKPNRVFESMKKKGKCGKRTSGSWTYGDSLKGHITFEGSTDLHLGFGEATYEFFGKYNVQCGKKGLDCCCKCVASAELTGSITDEYDFCSSLKGNTVAPWTAGNIPPSPGSMAWCGCILEDYFVKKGNAPIQGLGVKTFSVDCLVVRAKMVDSVEVCKLGSIPPPAKPLRPTGTGNAFRPIDSAYEDWSHLLDPPQNEFP